IISPSVGAIIVGPLSQPKAVLADVAPLLAAKAVSAAGVGGDSALARRVNCYWLFVALSATRMAQI
ncbi:MAG: hypothetical protein JSW56_07475, partial [Deltaproteobacteria bacterium]